MSQVESVKQLVTSVIEQAGRIDILVNNAGITRDAMLTKMTEDQFQQVLDVNLTGVFIVHRRSFLYGGSWWRQDY